MLPYVLTAVAGAVIGIVAARVWSMRDRSPTSEAERPAAQPDPSPKAGSSWSFSTIALLAAGVVAALSVAIILFRGGGQDGEGVPSAEIVSATGPAGATAGVDSVDVMIERLAKRLESAPDDGEGFRMLGWSYVNTGKPDKALIAYKRARELLPARADVHAGYGETLTDLAAGTVTAEAKTSFDRAIALDPKEPRARYFEALYKAQHGDKPGALDAWIKLANDGPAEASWQPDLRKRISETASELGQNVDARLKASAAPAVVSTAAPAIDASAVASASTMPETDRKAMIDNMVDGLARKLAANPRDPEGWGRLLRSRMVLKQADRAAQDLAMARKALAGSPDQVAQVNAVARELGVPGN